MAIRSFMPFAYVVYLQGSKVQGGFSHQCLIESYNELSGARAFIKDKYGLEFAEECTKFYGFDHNEFNNITDDRDITLVVERVDILNVKNSAPTNLPL